MNPYGGSEIVKRLQEWIACSSPISGMQPLFNLLFRISRIDVGAGGETKVHVTTCELSAEDFCKSGSAVHKRGDSENGGGAKGGGRDAGSYMNLTSSFPVGQTLKKFNKP